MESDMRVPTNSASPAQPSAPPSEDFSYRNLAPNAVIQDKSFTSIYFNVMPGRFVDEKLHIKEYRIWAEHIEGIFDREYNSMMARSPDHLIFLSSLIHLQKLIYVYLCHTLGYHYDPLGPEQMKVWPTRVDCKIPRMVRERTDLMQTLHVESFERRADGSYLLRGTSISQNALVITGDAAIFLLAPLPDGSK